MTHTFADAARNQGLGPIMDALTAAGIKWEIEQTGGWIMMLRVNLSGESFLGITEDDGLMICRYANAEEVYDGEPVLVGEGLTLNRAVEAIGSLVQEQAGVCEYGASGAHTRPCGAGKDCEWYAPGLANWKA